MAGPTPTRTFPTTFGQRVRELRLEAGLSQAELARAVKAITKSKIHKALVSQWELGRVANPQIATLDALATVFDCNHTWLSTGKGPKKANLGKALADHQQAQPLDRDAFRRAVECVVASKVTAPDVAASVALEVYDTVVESPTTDDAVLRRMVKLLKA